MGFANRRPLLPAATDSLLESADDTGLGTDIATDLSKLTDRTSHTIPADGSPITITTAKKRSAIGKLIKPGNQSQTSLLIEYFEGGPDSEKRPSVRVKVTPSGSRKSKEIREGHIVVTEAQGTRRPSQSHRIAFGSENSEQIFSGTSISALDSEVPLKRAGAPVEIEVLHHNGSDLSGMSASPEARFIVPESDISSMPPDSVIGISQMATMSSLPQGDVVNRGEVIERNTLKPPVLPTARNLSNERITQKVIEKLSNKPRTASGGRRHHSDRSHRRSSASREVEVGAEPPRRLAKNIEDESITTATGSSLVSGSLLSADPRSIDQRSVRSGTASNVSINNPKLLQTVEDAIRRLILPELKELKKDQRKASHHRHERDVIPSDISESSISRDDAVHIRSSGSKSRRRSSKEGVASAVRRRERHHKNLDYDSPSDHSYRNSESFDSVSIDEDRKGQKHRKSHRVRDAAAGALVGGVLTAAALKKHESNSSLDHRERRKKRSKSRSTRSASVTESEEIFQKHDVPPMPMRSEIGSELTRSSLLSSNTTGTATPIHHEVRQVVRGSPRGLLSPGNQTPTRTPTDQTLVTGKRGLGMHHDNFSEHDLAVHREEGDYETNNEQPREGYDPGFTALDHTLLTDPERAKAYERNLHHQHPIRRGLSPIQSVASYATTEPNRNSMIQPKSVESFHSLQKEQLQKEASIASLSSVTSTDLAKSKRPHGISLENRSEIMGQHEEGQGASRELDGGADEFFEEQHTQNDQYRDSYASSGPRIPLQHMSNYTDDSMDAPFLDKVTAGQHLAQGYGANPEYVHTPPGVESAVASLYDPSILDARGSQSPRFSHTGSHDQQEFQSPDYESRDLGFRDTGSPLKQQLSYHTTEDATKAAHFARSSPPQSVSESEDEVETHQQLPRSAGATNVVHTSDGHVAESPESEITTNPSVIQGPIGGLAQGSRDHWPYDPTPPRSKADIVHTGTTREPEGAGADLVPEALSINRTAGLDSKREAFATEPVNLSPPGAKDEGYETGANAPSPALFTREQKMPEPAPFDPDLELDETVGEEDPFTTQNRAQYISGFSQGMSPLYDSATGRGIDRIQSKDIVALMDHLTVRDAQRNARDTEILVTLVRSAAEMRNSFEDMKKFIAEQDDIIMDTADLQHERTQKVIGGPRPQPPSSTRFVRTPASEEEDAPTKRRNVFKRALRGLGSKNSQELQNIEAMLMQLLDDVEGLRVLQGGAPGTNEPRSTSFNSADNGHPLTDPGYEPEGQAGTSSTGGRSGVFSNNSSRQANYRGFSGPQGTGNRVSTVMEGDEEYDDYDDGAQRDYSHEDQQLTPRATPTQEAQSRQMRGNSVPLSTPPRMHAANQAAFSNENTPQVSTETSSRKHKSFASSFLPKMVSRWSKTTASSGGDNYRASTQTQQRPYSEVSRSGSNLGEFEYDPQGDDHLRSDLSFENGQHRSQENRPPSPLVPSQVSDNPKYQAHRNSVNLQHPQPRQGPTGRFQHHLESEAQYYHNDPTSPASQTSSQWENQAAMYPVAAGQTGAYMHGGQLSPISDGGYSETSAAMRARDGAQDVRSNRSVSSLSKQGPPRPPKVLDDEPLIPQRSSNGVMSPSVSSRQPTYVDHVAAARAGSPAFDQSPISAMRSSPAAQANRKPSGPRPLSTSGQYTKGHKGDMNMVKKTRFRGSPNQIDSDDEVLAY